jgi:hypothetical protein
MSPNGGSFFDIQCFNQVELMMLWHMLKVENDTAA